MPFAYCKLSLYLPECQNLKEKRSVLAGMLNQLKQMNISVIEAEQQDQWQFATLELVFVSANQALLEAELVKVEKLINNHFLQVQLLNFSKERYL